MWYKIEKICLPCVHFSVWPTEGKKKTNNILHYGVHSEENGSQIKRAE